MGAIAGHDTTALLGLLPTPVTFRAVTPTRFWDADTAIGVVDIVLGTWFSPDRSITEVESLELSTVEHVARLDYRLAVETSSGPAVIEQVAYYTEQDGRIADLRLVCSGFLPRDEASPRARP